MAQIDITPDTIKPQYLDVGGQQMVVLSAKDFERLALLADVHEPKLPEPNERGNYPIEALAIVTARDIIHTRRKLGLNQHELARLAGIRLKTLLLIEQAKNPPNVRTMDKIDRALKEAERKKRKPRSA
jgi:DNA-binding XRE family transcriptional regulator